MDASVQGISETSRNKYEIAMFGDTLLQKIVCNIKKMDLSLPLKLLQINNLILQKRISTAINYQVDMEHSCIIIDWVIVMNEIFINIRSFFQFIESSLVLVGQGLVIITLPFNLIYLFIFWFVSCYYFTVSFMYMTYLPWQLWLGD